MNPIKRAIELEKKGLFRRAANCWFSLSLHDEAVNNKYVKRGEKCLQAANSLRIQNPAYTHKGEVKASYLSI
ncbi:PerC family transcriptional regulator [Citrobacter sp. OP27]